MKESDFADLLHTIEALGFYKYVDPAEIERVRAEALECGDAFGTEETGRSYPADAEDLAEDGVLDFLQEVGPFLQRQNVVIDSFSEDFNLNGRYAVTVNGQEFEMYSQEEIEREMQGIPGDGIWFLTTTRAFAMVNRLLREAGSEERIFCLYGGNEQMAIFLTPEMYRAIDVSTALQEREKPEAFGEL